MGNSQTGGPWTTEERQWHINCLELQAANLAVRTFAKTQENIVILIRMDNTTAVAYINHLGGTVSRQATEITKDLWMWCLGCNIMLRAQHLPGRENTIADMESWIMKDRSDWRLNPKIFKRILDRTRLDIDLFASRLLTQLPKFFSWRPNPFALATDALLQDWSGMRAYANPPWNLIGKVLAKAQQHPSAVVMLVAPVWPAQAWYPKLLNLLVDYPLRIPQWEDLMIPLGPEGLPEVIPLLAVWPISGNAMQQQIFQTRLQSSCWPPGGPSQRSHMTQCSRSGSASVRDGARIPFRDL